MEDKRTRLEQARDWYLDAVDEVRPDGWKGRTLCSEWTPAQLVAHVASGDQLFRAQIMDALGGDRSGLDLPVDFADRQRRFQALAIKDPATLAATARREAEQSVALIIEAVETSPDLIVKVPFGTVPMNVVRALRLNEYIIHGHDLEPAIGHPRPVPDWFIDRALGDAITMLSRLHQRSPHKGRSASFHVHRTDGEGEWMVRAEGGQAVVDTGHGKADAAFRGEGASLYWVLMGRGKPEALGVEVHGDPAMAGAFKEWFPGP
jgi:uncharacterized protein (TIGR03083 family)